MSDFTEIRHVKKRAMLKALSLLGNVTKAAQMAGTDRHNHSRWMREDPKYAELTAVAIDEAADHMEAEAWRRAMQGVKKDVYYEGEVVGTLTEYSDTLLIFMLKGARPAKYRERYEHVTAGGLPIGQRQILNLEGLNLNELDQLASLLSKAQQPSGEAPKGLPDAGAGGNGNGKAKPE